MIGAPVAQYIVNLGVKDKASILQLQINLIMERLRNSFLTYLSVKISLYTTLISHQSHPYMYLILFLCICNASHRIILSLFL